MSPLSPVDGRLAAAILDYYAIDDRGTPYRHCKGCDFPELAHTCKLCQRCLSPDHDHTVCTLEPVK